MYGSCRALLLLLLLLLCWFWVRARVMVMVMVGDGGNGTEKEENTKRRSGRGVLEQPTRFKTWPYTGLLAGWLMTYLPNPAFPSSQPLAEGSLETLTEGAGAGNNRAPSSESPTPPQGEVRAPQCLSPPPSWYMY